MKTKEKTMFRQGDVLLVRCAAVPKTARRLQVEDSRLVLALGEVTGHSHAIEDFEGTNFKAFETPMGEMFLSLREPATLVHEEHGAITLPPGEYRRVIQRQFVPELNSHRSVVD